MDEDQIEFKNEPIDQDFILASIGNTKMKSLHYNPKIKQEVSETNTKSKICDESENLEKSGIFVKSETEIKPEIIFDTSESDSQHLMSDVISSDPLDLTVHEQKYRINLVNCPLCPKHFVAMLDLKKHLVTEHKVVKKAKNIPLTAKDFATDHEVIEQVKNSSLIHKMTVVKNDPLETTGDTLQGIS